MAEILTNWTPTIQVGPTHHRNLLQPFHLFRHHLGHRPCRLNIHRWPHRSFHRFRHRCRNRRVLANHRRCSILSRQAAIRACPRPEVLLPHWSHRYSPVPPRQYIQHWFQLCCLPLAHQVVIPPPQYHQRRLVLHQALLLQRRQVNTASISSRSLAQNPTLATTAASSTMDTRSRQYPILQLKNWNRI